MSDNSNGSRLISADELGAMLSLPSASIRRLAREGRLPCYRAGRLMRFDAEAVLAAMRQGPGKNDKEGQDD